MIDVAAVYIARKIEIAKLSAWEFLCWEFLCTNDMMRNGWFEPKRDLIRT